MSLIKCPECGEEVSDKARKCPNCAYSLKKISLNKNKIKKYILFIIIALIILIVGIIGFIKYTENKYVKKAESIVLNIINSSADCERIANLTTKVWYNTIYKKSDIETNKYTKLYSGSNIFNSDFNTSLNRLFIDKNEDIKDIKQDAESIANEMKQLTKFPKNEQQMYLYLQELYNSYQELVEITVNPTGSYSQYSQEKNTKINNCLNSYKKLKIYLPMGEE